MTITNYTLISSDNTHALSVRVNDCIKDGWQPFGNFSVTEVRGYYTYTQPLVKYKEN